MKFDTVKLKQGLSNAFSSLLAVVCAMIVSGLIVMITGVDPFAVFGSLFKGGFGSPLALAGTLNRMAPILLAGIAFTAGNACGVFNMGFEGQFLVGMLCAAWVGYMVPLPAPILMPLTFLSAIFGAMLWAILPAVLNIKRGMNIIFCCIMTNYISKFGVEYLIQQFPGYIATTGGTPPVPKEIMLPYLITKPQRISVSVIVALVCLVILYVLLFKTRTGYEMRATGLSQTAAYSAGISIERKAFSGMMLSAVFVGICAALELLCTTGNITENYRQTYMGLGIAIAMLGKQNPFMIFIAAFLFAAMKNGSTLMQMNTGISSQFVMVIEGLIIIFIGLSSLIGYIMNWLKERRAKKNA